MRSKEYIFIERPGFFGRKRDQIIHNYNCLYGKNNWTLVWTIDSEAGEYACEFEEACYEFYEHSYHLYLADNLDLVDELISNYSEIYDNDISNIQSGLDYTKQESYSTHIQDIAIRNVLHKMGLPFKGPSGNLLQVRHKEGLSNLLSPGTVPFYDWKAIQQPSTRPLWSKQGSVEDFWQSNKWLVVRRTME